MKIAVTTPSGHVGQVVARHLVRAGVRPVLLTPHPKRIPADIRDRAEAIATDLTEPEAVLRATRGLDALYAVVPPTGAEDPLTAYETIGSNLASAVIENHIPRTVFQSSVGAELRHGAGEIDGLATVEQMLDSALGDRQGVVHLRCGFFYTNLLYQLDAIRAGTVPTLWPVDRPMPWVAPRDIADVATAYLLRPDWRGRHVQAVHGPQDLSWAEAMGVVSDVTGRRVEAVRIEDGEMRAALLGAGMSPAAVEAMVGMSIGLREGFEPEQERDVTTTTETSLSAWAHEVLAPLLAPA
ncbi:uncharacterized protein YbjT (DUF2867 family) [Nocardioides thalensis]|uniref:Uncharacterized protein YbjT (DUF2867 family) n=1 Tax=Nocardioides thalensis TaxID=1914755 RepID=A0A853C487_9ACTN|nr:NAD(P)H-binding protein [Nocardioides thalensis]NYJ02254.1 uncharacterized protein YbjT (DUF2867 family) [Nocardioides thalensis]